jgi:hypothetical protein
VLAEVVVERTGVFVRRRGATTGVTSTDVIAAGTGIGTAAAATVIAAARTWSPVCLCATVSSVCHQTKMVFCGESSCRQHRQTWRARSLHCRGMHKPLKIHAGTRTPPNHNTVRGQAARAQGDNLRPQGHATALEGGQTRKKGECEGVAWDDDWQISSALCSHLVRSVALPGAHNGARFAQHCFDLRIPTPLQLLLFMIFDEAAEERHRHWPLDNPLRRFLCISCRKWACPPVKAQCS